MVFDPTTAEHFYCRTINQIAITALAPSADCQTFAVGYVLPLALTLSNLLTMIAFKTDHF